MSRIAMSRPVGRAIEDNIITIDTTVFDYGCGRGGDVERLQGMGVKSAGYDPNFFPKTPLAPAKVVNLGYVVNVIEHEHERAEVLRKAWRLAQDVLVVSGRLAGEARRLAAAGEHADGVVTGLGTFQRFYQQDELRNWIEETLGTATVAAEPGIFYVFRAPARAELYLLTRVRRRRPRRRRSDVVFEDNQELLQDLMGFLEERGRLPRAGEFERVTELNRDLGSARRAFQIIKTVTGEERWDRARVAAYEDALVYLALSRFRRRPKFSHLPPDLQHDIKDFFGSYKAACDQAQRTLFSIGEQRRIVEAIRAATVGKKMPTALYVHTSGVDRLPVCLRVLEGCARELLGALPEATIVKFDTERPRVAYLEYPEFDSDPHPALRAVFVAVLDAVRTDYQDYASRSNPPILHRKERFVPDDYPLRERFARLTAQEVRAGLYADPSAIGTKRGWTTVLSNAGVTCRGHRLVRGG